MSQESLDKRFSGLCFPVIRVRYHGPTDNRGSRWIATIRQSNECTFRATVEYSYELPSGSQNAIRAARAVWAKLKQYQAEQGFPLIEQDRVFIPGDLDADTYAFTVVPTEFLR